MEVINMEISNIVNNFFNATSSLESFDSVGGAGMAIAIGAVALTALAYCCCTSSSLKDREVTRTDEQVLSSYSVVYEEPFEIEDPFEMEDPFADTEELFDGLMNFQANSDAVNAFIFGRGRGGFSASTRGSRGGHVTSEPVRGSSTGRGRVQHLLTRGRGH